MTHDEAIASLLDSVQKYEEIVKQLKEENAFLAETIEKNNLGRIISERRTLLAENKQSQKEVAASAKKANALIVEYESKMSEADALLADAKRKQADLESYIEEEAERKLADIKEEYRRQREDNDILLKKERKKLRQKYKGLLALAILSILVTVFSIVLWFAM